MLQTRVLLWTTLTSSCSCVTEKSSSVKEMRPLHLLTAESGTASISYCLQDVAMCFFFHRRYTVSVLSTNFSFATLCTEALKITCRARAWRWISEGCFCWFRGKCILQHMQPAKCPISAVKNLHRGRIVWIREPSLPTSYMRESMTSMKYQTVS